MNLAAEAKLTLLHGWGLGSAIWQPVLPALALRFCADQGAQLRSLPGYAMPGERMAKQAADRGHQKTPEYSPGVRPDQETPSFTATAQALADGLPDGSILCGWSLGGMLALQAALLAPQRLRGLILVGSTPSFTQRRDWPHAHAPALLDGFRDAIAKDPGATLQRFIALLNQGDSQARQIGRTMLRQLQTVALPDTPTLLAGLDWLRDVDLRARLPSITVPTLLIHGSKDPLMPLEAAQWLADRLPNADLEIFSGAAHAPFLADPERFAALVGDFCDRCHAPAAG